MVSGLIFCAADPHTRWILRFPPPTHTQQADADTVAAWVAAITARETASLSSRLVQVDDQIVNELTGEVRVANTGGGDDGSNESEYERRPATRWTPCVVCLVLNPRTIKPRRWWRRLTCRRKARRERARRSRSAATSRAPAVCGLTSSTQSHRKSAMRSGRACGVGVSVCVCVCGGRHLLEFCSALTQCTPFAPSQHTHTHTSLTSHFSLAPPHSPASFAVDRGDPEPQRVGAAQPDGARRHCLHRRRRNPLGRPARSHRPSLARRRRCRRRHNQVR